MQLKYLQILEYPKILTRLSHYTMFSASKTLVQNLTPTYNYTEAVERQQETSEARHILSVKPNLGIGGARDVRPLIEKARRNIIIVAADLLTIRQTLIAARDLRRNIVRLEDRYGRLADIAYRLGEEGGLVNDISQCIDDSGKVKDSASPNLTRIRREIEIAHNRLMEKMRRLMASERYKPYLQEGFITQRDGRYVLPLKSDFKGRIKGIIHDQSTSGATLFVEPAAIVEINNNWKQLLLAEEQEVKRILLVLTQKVAEQGKFIAATVQALAELDLIFAKARYAEAIEATSPVLYNWAEVSGKRQDSPISPLNLKQARHPLLKLDQVVPINLRFADDIKMVVITGPNTGGKTVSLKTVGLLALMAQSGLHLPVADGSSLMVFDAIFADIGDEQSLEQNLSTFSAHMNNIVNILKSATPQSLLIFDELGAGTDPIEGAALALSILNHLLEENITTLVATHYAELKAFAYTTPSVANASMAFDLKTLSPTYKLLLGIPGNSNAFAIAQQLGLSEVILKNAQGLMGEEAKKTELMLAQIKADLEAARMERLRIEEERAEAEYYRQKIEERLAKVNEERNKILAEAHAKAKATLNATRIELNRLKKDAEKAVAKAQKISKRSKEEKIDKLNETNTKSEIEASQARLNEIENIITAQAPCAKTKPSVEKQHPLKVGGKVTIPHLNSTGLITNITPTEVEVQLGHFRTTVKRRKVIPLETPEPETPLSTNTIKTMGETESPGWELDLRGQISEQAQDNLETYLDRAYLSGLPFVRIIHGKGSGVLRTVVSNILKDHPFIASYKLGNPKEGGEGVTVAKLAI